MLTLNELGESTIPPKRKKISLSCFLISPELERGVACVCGGGGATGQHHRGGPAYHSFMVIDVLYNPLVVSMLVQLVALPIYVRPTIAAMACQTAALFGHCQTDTWWYMAPGAISPFKPLHRTTATHVTRCLSRSGNGAAPSKYMNAPLGFCGMYILSPCAETNW